MGNQQEMVDGRQLSGETFWTRPQAPGSCGFDYQVEAATSGEHEERSWYAVRTRSRHEVRVFQQIAQKNIEVFLPTTTRWSQWKDRRKRIEWPLFPGYCFARLHFADRLRILTCAGVVSFVSFAGTPAPIPDSQVTSLRRLVQGPLQWDPCPFIREGAMVEIVRGPLCGVVGRLLQKDPVHATVVLSVDLISRALRVEVDAMDVRLR
jgi:transcription antitermination factor NusG